MSGRSTIVTPELLAPAGSIECFHAALEAGADAVYLGLTDFNARLRAKNFTAKTLSYVAPYARSRNVKIYVTFNTLLKQADLEPAIHLLYQLDQIGVDALIVTDLGLINIAREHFPRLSLHGSTQMVIHNAAGVTMAGRLGLQRVILSRECSLGEIEAIKRTSRIELEVFIHGALCYSVSGLCLASSFLGGSSGNRGRCTQVCRRRFSTGRSGGCYFSPRDLETIGLIPALAKLGIASFKIEGRMKNPEYVYQVTRAYRMVIDDPKRMDEAKMLLKDDLGRKKTSFFLSGTPLPGTIDAVSPGMGVLIGEIAEFAGNRIIVKGAAAIREGDRLRIQPRDGFEGEAASVDSAETAAHLIALSLKKPIAGKAGDAVYLVSRHSVDKQFNLSTVQGVKPTRFIERFSKARLIVRGFESTGIGKARRDTLWIKIDDFGWLDLLHNTPCQRLVIAGDLERLASLLSDAQRLRIWRSRLVVALPQFIPEGRLAGWRSLIKEFKSEGVGSWMCTNIGHRALFDRDALLFADIAPGCMNRACRTAVCGLGIKEVVYSLEDDYLNIKASAQNGIACLYSIVPLFISRLHPAVRTGAMVSDPHGNRFNVIESNGLYWLIAEKPFCITHRKAKLAELGIRDFLLDLSFKAPDRNFLSSLIRCYQIAARMPDTGLFNFKAGFK
jgi:U32 family peptidase